LVSVAKRRQHPWPVRLAHWLNVPLLIIMAGSGIQILVAYPHLGPQGQRYSWYPFDGWLPPAWARLGEWLAGARHWHFAFAWLFVANGLLWVGWLIATGEWRRRMFLPKRDVRNAIAMIGYYLRLRKEAPPHDPYNGLQRFAYSSALVLGALLILSGLAIYKPVQLWFLVAPLGSYDSARAIHFIALGALTLFSLVHVVLVLLHPRTLGEMVTGGSRDDAP
jgi:thiosulfate reductase cytochrome b subunit